MRNDEAAGDAQPLSTDSGLRIFVFLLLLSFSALLECWKLSSLRDPEIWGHLRSGTWILQNKTWPESGLFSQAWNLSWQDFSWGYDLFAAMAYRLAGLRALPALLLISRFALAVVTFLLAGGWRNFWSAVCLSAVAQYVLLLMGPTPAFVSVILSGLELLLLLDVREFRSPRAMFVLPLLFAFWANLDTGFVYGIALYLLFLAALFLERRDASRNSLWFDRPLVAVPLQTAIFWGSACLFASLLNPYTFHPYAAFLANEFSLVNRNLPGYNAMSFRQPQDYALMLLGMTAYFSLGLLRSRDFFQIGALAGCTALAFHAQRENWLLALASVAVVGHAALRKDPAAMPTGPLPWNWRRVALSVAALALALIVFAARVPRNQDVLLAQVAQTFPVRAADFLRQHPQAPPFFNVYQWGGFLTWYLPEYPVAIDARRDLYAEETELGYFKAMNADIPYRDFPPMNQARTLLMDKASIMGQALRGVTGFQVIYEDEISIVYSRGIKE